MKREELLELPAAKRFDQLLQKRVQAEVNLGARAVAAATRTAAQRQVSKLDAALTEAAENVDLRQRYAIYAEEALLAIEQLKPLEDSFPPEQIAAWRETYETQVAEACSFFESYCPDSPEAQRLLGRLNGGPVLSTQAAPPTEGNAVNEAAEAGADIAIYSEDTAVLPQAPEKKFAGYGLLFDEDEEGDEVPSAAVASPAREPRPWITHQDEPTSTPPRSPYNQIERTEDSDEESGPPPAASNGHIEYGKNIKPPTENQVPSRIEGQKLSDSDRSKLNLIRLEAEAIATVYLNSTLGPDPESPRRSTQIRAVLPKFTPTTIRESSEKLFGSSSSSHHNFKLKEVIAILLYDSRITRNIYRTRKYTRACEAIIEEAIATALKAKKLADANVK